MGKAELDAIAAVGNAHNGALPWIFAKYVAPAPTKLASYEHAGLTLDLHGSLTEGGYKVTDATVPGTTISVRADADLLLSMSCWCDDVLPTSKELRRESADAARAEHAAHDRAMA
ncbi:MAG TPA: hypothetical protein VF800_02815 [Telluria sp.]|jgi:hypothetical protein